MGVALILGLIVAVVSLLWLVTDQQRTIKNYEQELIKKARKNKNATK